jgi:hypothetical protein
MPRPKKIANYPVRAASCLLIVQDFTATQLQVKPLLALMIEKNSIQCLID